VRAKPLVLKDGTIVSGSSMQAYDTWAAWIERSTDGGKTWAKIGPIEAPTNLKNPENRATAPANPLSSPKLQNTTGIIQPSVVEIKNKHLRFYARSTENIGRVVAADSYDNGRTWTQAHSLDVPNPNSGIDAVVLRDGRIVLVYNNTTSGRTPLNMAVSTDGEHFRMFRALETGPGEFSYPSLIQVGDGSLEMTYTWNRVSIKHVHLPLSDVPKE
jgi:predicted neuraminidase